MKIRSFLVQSLIVILITLLLGEIALRIYDHYRPSFVFYSGTYNRFRGKPFAADWDFNLNSHGFKDEEFDSTKKQGFTEFWQSATLLLTASYPMISII